MMAVSSSQQLVRELTEHNDFFDMLVDMIPSKLYIAGQSGDDYNPKYFKSPTEQQSRSARKAAAKAAKRRKLDPSTVETTVQVKQRLDNTSEASSIVPSKKHDVQDNGKNKQSETASSSEKSKSNNNKSYQSRIEALREKLHTKIATAQQNRPPPDQVSKRAARRAEKRKRRQEAAARNNKKMTSSSSSTQVGEQTKYNTMMVTPDNSKMSPSLDTLDFGCLSGFNSQQQQQQNYTETNKALANLNKSKNIQKLLQDAEAKRLKLQALKQSSNIKDQQKVQAMQWKDTFHEADGQRVKEDPQLLKKALKRKQAKKKKSTKAWKSRLEQTRANMQERQEIRRYNLSARKQGGRVGANLSKKRIIIVDNDATAAATAAPDASTSTDNDADAGRRLLSRAGFEGRKQDFLNSGSSKKKHQ